MNFLRAATRRYSAMPMPVKHSECSPFTRCVVSAMRKLYPEALADKSFDNTGLLLEAPFDQTPFDKSRILNNSVLLTIDLTTAVADEAIKERHSVIVAYHPIIFRGLKSLTFADSQQRTLLRLAQHGISVYSPHTAVDTVPGGMADWLCDVVTGNFKPVKQTPKAITEHCNSSMYSAPTYPESPIPAVQAPSSQEPAHARSTIHPSPPASIPEGFESAGAGRLVTFAKEQPLTTLIDNIARGIGLPGGIPIAIPQGMSVDAISIRTVGMCPGSGSGVLLKGDGELPDLLLTGEMSHHEALAATERGSVVISLSHTNSERGYLRSVMQPKLQDEVTEQWSKAFVDSLEAIDHVKKFGGLAPSVTALRTHDLYKEQGVARVSVSEADRDPYGIMIWRGN
ncbi:NGG1p interacting factor 3 NIF3 [Penicillium cf. griseofulvum]|uniref:NGG1p interacting factor 3 NIF3 n=1 Tax=Penicillium cf. griseofulvum TaxID=2972120 RepID=A0A9W9MRG4_9EURO|nr:NGG1p interacting factor 3 NIF3 [Penicillium cf. griseofulvum]KAJ5440866.1 NGG1p interacting factor 3 NIF3 [Penicillium cf. griseofulvum]KAJ5448911.1 NGG1p interacting factor 3 NIF3 [Penicillium cf. griseofulvum]